MPNRRCGWEAASPDPRHLPVIARKSRPAITSTTNRARCRSGSHSSTDGGSRKPVSRSIGRKLLMRGDLRGRRNSLSFYRRLPRRVKSDRLLANDLVCCDTVMEPFAREILAQLAETGEPIPLILDQTTASDRHQILMLSVRWGERALPLAWRVEETAGAIGFATQQELLAVVAGWLPADLGVVLLADRFYGTPAMIRWCRDRGWDYRLRLKGNFLARWGTLSRTLPAFKHK